MQQLPRALALGAEFGTLVYLFVIGADQRVDDQRNTVAGAVAPGGGDIALTETRHVYQVRSGQALQSCLYVGGDAKQRIKIGDRPAQGAVCLTQDTIARVIRIEPSPPQNAFLVRVHSSPGPALRALWKRSRVLARRMKRWNAYM